MKARYPFCWVCSRKLRGNSHAEVEIDGERRIVHKSCAPGFPLDFDSEQRFYVADASGSCPVEDDEVTR